MMLPVSSKKIMKDTIEKMLMGANSIFKECKVDIAGGHTIESESETILGFAISGRVKSANFNKKFSSTRRLCAYSDQTTRYGGAFSRYDEKKIKRL